MPNFDVAEPNTVIVLESPNRLGPAWFVNNIIEYNNKTKYSNVFERINSSEFNPAITAFVNTDIVKNYVNVSSADLNTEVVVESYGATKIVMKTKNSQPGLLVTSDIYYPGWKAYVDGKKVDITEVNYTCRRLNLEAGEYTIEFKFMPTIYIVSFIICTLVVFLTRNNKNKKKLKLI